MAGGARPGDQLDFFREAKEGKSANSKEVAVFVEVEKRVSNYFKHEKCAGKAARKEGDAPADATAAARALNGGNEDGHDDEYDDVSDETAHELETYFSQLQAGASPEADGDNFDDKAGNVNNSASSRVAAILAQPCQDATGLRKLNDTHEQVQRKMGICPVDLSRLLAKGDDKPSLAAAYRLFRSEKGTTKASRLSRCPTCKTTFNAVPPTVHRHIKGCIGLKLTRKLKKVNLAYVKSRATCPLHDCDFSLQNTTSQRAMESHFRNWHGEKPIRGASRASNGEDDESGGEDDEELSGSADEKESDDEEAGGNQDGGEGNAARACGFANADGTRCVFKVQGATSHPHSMDRALLDLHRMRVHAFTPVAVSSGILFSDGDWATGLIDALQVSAARCPHDGDTISSTHLRLTSEMCPVCFLDGALVPSERIKEHRGDLARHFFRTHVLKKKQGYTDADAIASCPCCSELLPIWTVLEHLYLVGLPIVRRGRSSNALERLKMAGKARDGDGGFADWLVKAKE